jgi:hypothetical protein
LQQTILASNGGFRASYIECAVPGGLLAFDLEAEAQRVEKRFQLGQGGVAPLGQGLNQYKGRFRSDRELAVTAY